jgi:hypothetical protein
MHRLLARCPRSLVLIVTGALLATGAYPAGATDLEVTYAETVRTGVDDRPPGLRLTVEWSNSWHNERNHDAA